MNRRYLLLLVFLCLSASVAVAQKGKPAPGLSTAECIACHSDPSLTKEVNGKQVSLAVDEGAFKNSIHGAFDCNTCHADITAYPHEPAPKKVDCSTCHAEPVQAHANSMHAKAAAAGNPNAPTCASCHGNVHQLVSRTDPKSPVAHQNIPSTCGTCHGQKFVMQASGRRTGAFYSYQQSVHGKLAANLSDPRSAKAAVCTDCHNSHDVKSPGDPSSPVFKFNVPQTCAKCHEGEKAEFVNSVHGKAVARGNWQSPVCTDCHGIHLIKAAEDPTSPVSAQHLSESTCARCHESVRMSTEFGIEGSRASTFLQSYHGLAVKGGSQVAANCASCHGVHDILPSSDPKSRVSQERLVETCGQCHPGATQNFVASKVHVDAPLSADVGSIAMRWVRNIYLLLIVGTIGFMVAHNLIIWIRKAVDKRKAQRRIVQRMSNSQRIQHLLLLTSFITLVITGFALTYPGSILGWIFPFSESVRSWTHRIAGAVLIGTSLYHLYYVVAKRAGRKLIYDMMPIPKDAVDLFSNMRYYLGLGGVRPEFGRFNYAEKMEYWALVWGTIVMAATGLALWFKVFVGNILPRWWLDVATAIHFYEAVLATLAILVWHFYMVFFDPDVYPMNWAWKDGKMDIELYHHEHGADHETISKSIEEAAAKAEEEEPAEERK